MYILPEDYIYTQSRRRLKHDAVPSVNISHIVTNAEMNNTNATEVHLRPGTSTEQQFETINEENAEMNMSQNNQNDVTNEAVLVHQEHQEIYLLLLQCNPT